MTRSLFWMLAILLLSPHARSREPASPPDRMIDTPPDGSFVRITLDGGVSPFTMVAWDVTVRGPTSILSLVKESLCHRGQRERVRMLEGEGASGILRQLVEAGAWSMAVPEGAGPGRSSEGPPTAREPRYEFWTGLGRTMTRFSLPESRVLGHPDLVRVLVAVQDVVSSRVDPLPMRNLYHPPQRLGFLSMTASEPARAVLDGWDSFRLPVDALEVVEGEHGVLVVGESGRRREFKVRVAAGITNRIHVVLE